MKYQLLNLVSFMQTSMSVRGVKIMNAPRSASTLLAPTLVAVRMATVSMKMDLLVAKVETLE